MLYTSAFIAEIVRAGILAVTTARPRRPARSACAAGQTLRLVVLPQAMRVIMPPLTSQYLNLTKNSSLAVAIGYPDLVAVFAGTVLNQTGQAVEIIFITMVVYLSISLSTSAFMNWFNRASRWWSAEHDRRRIAPSAKPRRLCRRRSRGRLVGWLRKNLFSSVGNTILTVVIAAGPGHRLVAVAAFPNWAASIAV